MRSGGIPPPPVIVRDTFAVRDEYSSVFLAVREALLFAIYSDDCIVSSFLEALAQ